MDKPDRPDYAALLREGYRTIERLQNRLQALERARSEPVAIVGMGCRLPGGVTDPEAYWELLRNGADAISEIPASRWNVSSYYDADAGAAGKMSTRWGGFIEDVDRFDAQFFGISPREAVSMDPQQRILLEVAWEALENAGVAPDSLMGSRTGVFVGISTNDYGYIQSKIGAPETYDAYLATGNSHSMASGRLAYVFGLQGPAFSVDTACSSSLIAVHLACQALRAGHARAALAAGVNLILTPEATVTLSKAQMMARDGRCKTFSAEADGFVRAEGCGVVVLKRLSDARADGDRIQAVIRGSAINQDGRSNGLTAPNGLAQVALVQQALADAGVRPEQVGYVETHGTGTPLGDPIEVQALADALTKGRRQDNRLKIGSVKTNVGHLEGAAGIAGLMKVVLALQHRELPAHLHLRTPNPHVPWAQIPVDVTTDNSRWESTGPRIAGVSSFGFSGSNSHVVLEEAPDPPAVRQEASRPLHLLPLSARSAAALNALASRYLRHFDRHPETPLADVCFTAGAGRAHFSHRLALSAGSTGEARGKLEAYLADPAKGSCLRGQSRRPDRPEVAFLFTGQGAQYQRMGMRLYQTQPTFRRALERCADLLRGELERPLVDVLFPASADDETIHRTACAQPALFALEYALAELWRSWGIEPGVVAGHSVGEYVAACVAGVVTLEAALKLVAARGRLMQALPQGGAMAALEAGAPRVEALIRAMELDSRVCLAAINAPESTVISGAGDAVGRVCARLEADGLRTRTLAVSHAFHSHTMEPMLAPFEAVARTFDYAAPRIAWVSTVTGGFIQEVDAVYWRRQVREPVRFAAAVGQLRRRGVELAVEAGPSPVLLTLARQCGVDAPGWVGSLRKGHDDWEEMLAALGTLYVQGAAVDWSGVDRDYSRARVPLPTYPFERQRYWWAPAARSKAPSPAESDGTHPLLMREVRSPLLTDRVYESEIGVDTHPFLADHRIFGTVVFPVAAFLEMALAAVRRTRAGESCSLEEVAVGEALTLAEGGRRTVQIVVDQPPGATAGFKVFSQPSSGGGAWRLHAGGHARALGNTPGRVAIDGIRERCQRRVDVGDHYETLRGYDAEYGPSFRGLTHLSAGFREALGRVSTVPPLRPEAGAYGIHPALLDAALQVVGAAMAGQVDDTYLPAGLDSFALYGPAPESFWSHAALHPDTSVPESLKADVTLLDDSGSVVAAVRGLLLKRTPRRDTLRPPPALAGDWFYGERWEPAPARSGDPRPSGVWLVFAVEGGPGDAVASELRKRGEAVVAVRPGETYAAPADCASTGCAIDAANPEHYNRVLADAARLGPCAGVVYAWADAALATAGLREPDVLQCRGAFYLARAAGARDDVHNVWFVTCGAQAASGAGQALVVSQAPLTGFARSLALEHPALGARRVDFDPEAAAEANAALLVEDLLAGGDEDEIAFRGGNRLARRLERVSLPAGSEQAAPPIRADATYLVTGGFGGLGLTVARWLVNRGARHLVLAGRRGATGTAVGAVQEFERRGVTVRQACADVADETSMRALAADVAATMPPLRGMVHTAGVVEDGPVARLTWEAFERVLAPKAHGVRILHLMSEKVPLDFFVLFSSTASFFGSPVQSNYAAANAYLDASAYQLRAQARAALSINWGFWEGVGMAAGLDSRHRNRWAREGVGGITPETGMAALERVLGRPGAQVAVLPVDWARVVTSGGTLSRVPFVSHWLARSGAGAPAGQAPALSRSRLLAAAPEDRAGLITQYLRETVAAILGLSPADLEMDTEIAGFGFDSLMAMDLRNRLEAGLGETVPMRDLLGGWTLRTLARSLAEAVESGSGAADRGHAASAVLIQEGEI